MMNNTLSEGNKLTKPRSIPKVMELNSENLLIYGGKEVTSRSGLIEVYNIISNTVVSVREY